MDKNGKQIGKKQDQRAGTARPVTFNLLHLTFNL